MRWDISAAFAAVIAIFLTISPSAVGLIQGIVKAALRKTIPHLGRCEKLEWSDIPDGPLHDCKSATAYCNNIYCVQEVPVAPYSRDIAKLPPHNHERCWANLASMVLSRAWDSASRRQATVRKPAGLAIDGAFLCTDVETLNVIRLFMPSGKLDFSVTGGCLVVHLKPEYLMHYPGLTKTEAAKIASGFLPWYRETLTTAGGVSLPTPLRELADTCRGGWIFGVGLSLQEPTKSYKLAPGVMSNITIDQESYAGLLGMTSSVNRAFKRVQHAIDKLGTAFPDNPSIQQAQEIFRKSELNSIIPNTVGSWAGTLSILTAVMIGSGLFQNILSDGYSIKALKPRVWARSLTIEQCSVGIHTFNTLMPMSTDEVEVLRPVLRPIIQAAVFGLFEVCRFRGERLLDLPEAKGRSRIFLRACSPDEGEREGI